MNAWEYPVLSVGGHSQACESCFKVSVIATKIMAMTLCISTDNERGYVGAAQLDSAMQYTQKPPE
jgi:hypothetical protein